MKRAVPLAFVVIAVLYLALAFSFEDRRMIGDEKGWDPGPRALPVAIGALMLGISAYLTFRGWKAPAASASVPGPAMRLIVLTAVLTSFYIAVFRFLGFVLATTVLLYLLFYFNSMQNVRLKLLPSCMAGLAASTALTLILYSVGKWVSRALLAYGRSIGSTVLADRTLAAGISFLAVTALFVVVVLISKAIRRARSSPGRIPVAILTAAAMTEGLYIVFRQIFLVSLAPGLILW
jgi:hypothetical protein